MRAFLFVPAVGLVAALIGSPPAVSQDEPGAVDLLGRDLKDWTRIGSGKNPWRLTVERTLMCTPANDGYAPDNEFWDGTLKFEYRFRPTGEKTGYKASVSVRRSLSSAGSKVALGDNCGTMISTFQGSSDRSKEVETRPGRAIAKPVGEWNDVKVEMRGHSVEVTINGKPAGTFDRCDRSHGLVYFESEGSEIEFRRILWKATN
jgi:Domain of Unknown Function (DUF1080)